MKNLTVCNDVDYFKSIGIDYYGYNPELTPILSTKYAMYHNAWLTIHGNGADLRLKVVTDGDSHYVAVVEVGEHLSEPYIGAVFPLTEWGIKTAWATMHDLAETIREIEGEYLN